MTTTRQSVRRTALTRKPVLLTSRTNNMFQTLTGIYEPSAIQQLPDGRFLVVEDEKEHPFSLVTLGLDGSDSSTPLTPGWFESGDDDLEGVALDRAGNLYAVTSHSRDNDGNEKMSCDKLVRFHIEGERVKAQQVVKV